MVRTSTRPRKTSAYNLTGAFDLYPQSYRRVRRNLGIFAALSFFPFVAGLSNGAWGLDSERNLNADSVVFANAVGNSTLPVYIWGGLSLLLFVTLIFAVILRVMTHSAQLEASEGRKVRLKVLWEAVKAKAWPMFLVYLLSGLLIVIGLIFLIIPGIIMLRRYFLAPYVMLDNDTIGVWDAMEKSASMTKKHSRSIYSIIGVMILISMAGVVPLIGWMISFVLAFFYSVAPALRYQELKKLS
jgi:hypothetical protein